MKSHRLLLFSCALLFLCHCGTTPKEQKTYLPKSQSSYRTHERYTPKHNDIDVNALLEELNLNHPVSNIGYRERSFNTCRIRANRSTNPSCKKLYLSRLNFQVMCRNSTGTVSSVSLTPLTSKKLRWKQGGRRGTTSTNSQGFGSLGFVSNHSARNGHLYLYLGNKIARKRFRDQWKLILPRSWCLSQ